MTDNGEAVPSRRLLTRSTSYIPYGEVFVEESSTGWQSPFYFNSKELDEETGLYYYGARYLDPTEARWLSVDPMWEKYVGMSPYNYCAGNPVKYVDEDGREKIMSFDLSKDENQKIKKAADAYPENVGVIHVWVHGIVTNKQSVGIEYYNLYGDGESVDITTPMVFHTILEDYSSVYNQNREEDIISILVLHSCSTGKKEGFAQEISKAYDDLIVIAPSENIQVAVTDDTSFEMGVKGNGCWNVFYKGNLVDSFNGKTKPIFNNPQKIAQKYERKWLETQQDN